jgi:hypothetical protein
LATVLAEGRERPRSSELLTLRAVPAGRAAAGEEEEEEEQEREQEEAR